MPQILVLVDYRPLGQALALTLQHAGYQVELAGSTTDILRAVTQPTCDLFVLDIPQIHGVRWRLWQTIHHTPQAVPLVLLLPPADPGWQVLTTCAACLPLTHFIRKHTLLRCLHTALRPPRPHHTLRG